MKISSKTSFCHRRVSAVVSGLALLSTVLWGGSAFAAGTVSGTTVSNLATLSFSVGGVPQANIGSSVGGNTSGAGTATTFLVDNKVNLTVVEKNNTFTTSAPGSITQVTAFNVINTGNTVQDFNAATANLASGTSLFTRTDNFDATSCIVRVDSAPTASVGDTFAAGTDTAVFIDELAPDGSRTVYVVCSIPAGQANNDFAVVSLTGTARAGGAVAADPTNALQVGAALVETAGADTAAVDIVFADAAGSDDLARAANHSARDAYLVASALISVAKTSLLLCDPFNGVTNPKHIPGAIVRWTITITNGGGATASATLATVADTLNANTAFDVNLVTPTNATTCSSTPPGVPTSAPGRGFSIDVTGDGRAAGDTSFPPTFLTTAGDGDGATAAGLAVTIDYAQALPADATGAITYAAGELKPGEAVSVFFNVTIN